MNKLATALKKVLGNKDLDKKLEMLEALRNELKVTVQTDDDAGSPLHIYSKDIKKVTEIARKFDPDAKVQHWRQGTMVTMSSVPLSAQPPETIIRAVIEMIGKGEGSKQQWVDLLESALAELEED